MLLDVRFNQPRAFSSLITLFSKIQLVVYYQCCQEYPTEPLDKIPALQAEFELAEKKKHWLISCLGNLNERLASRKNEKLMTVLAG